LFGELAAELLYVSGGQVNLLVPGLNSGANASVTIIRGTARSAPFPADVVAVAPGLFEIVLGSERRGAVTDATGNVIALNTRASPGQVLIAYLTGLGESDPVPGSPGLRASRVPPRVVVEGRAAQVQFAGPSPNFPGLDQINFVVPATTSAAREVELWIEQADRKSNVVALPVR
jgi:uncharacterized protein (TIGR03437 family)